MKKKIIATILISGILFFGASEVFGGFQAYGRNPAGYDVENPIVFSYEMDIDIFLALGCIETWRLLVTDEEITPVYFTEYFASTTLSTDWELNLADGIYTGVSIECEGGVSFLEFNPSGIFEITSPRPPFVDTDDVFVAGVIGYARGWLGSGIFPYLAMIIGIPLAFVVIKKVIKLVPK